MTDPAEQRPDVVSLGDEEGVKKVLLNSNLELWEVMNHHAEQLRECQNIPLK
jgi:hypothetical protein